MVFDSVIKQSVFGLVLGLLSISVLACSSQAENGDYSKLASERATSTQISLNPDSAQKAPQSYRFIAFGDWGAGTAYQKAVAKQAYLQYQRAPFDSVLMLGDNIYEKGDVNKLGKAYFTDTYAPLISQGVQFIVALGNHDVIGGFKTDQLRFFKMPGDYYQVHKPLVDFFVLETNFYAGDKIQQQWLAYALKNSRAPWKIVMGHQPIYSSGWEGGSPNFEKTLQPLLERYHVQLYLAGHDHNYEHLKAINGVQYIVSGGGGAYLRNKKNNIPQSLLFIKKHHFLSFQLTAQTLSMDVIDSQGEKIDHLDIQNPLFAGNRLTQ
jgi:hypothetical protein